MRNDFTFYLNLIRGLAADEAGKRFPDAMLRSALRQALNDYQRAFPRLRTVPARAAFVDEFSLRINVPVPEDEIIVGLRLPNPESEIVLLEGDTVHRENGHLLLRLAPELHRRVRRIGASKIDLVLSAPQTVAGLDENMTETTVPSRHASTLAKGAAAAALRIRAAAVTEVHGKRVEEITALSSAAKTLFGEFRGELAELGMTETGCISALPNGPSFPI